MSTDAGSASGLQHLREVLRRERLNLGLTQKEVAAALGWSQAKLARIESGDVRVSSTDLEALQLHYGLADLLIETISLPRGRTQGYRSIFAVDAIGSTQWTNAGKEIGRALMYRMLGDAFQTCGIKPFHHDPLVDRGDGILALIRAVDEVPKKLLLGVLIPKLRELLAGQSALRLRAVLHAGEVHDDGRGPFGEALDTAFRLLEANEVKRFDRATDSPLLLVVSDDFYRTVVQQYFTEEASRFVSVKHRDRRNGGKVYHGWVLT